MYLFSLKKSGVSFFYEKTFLLKYVMWIFPLSTTIHGSKINIKGRKKKDESRILHLFFLLFSEKDHIAKKNSSKNAIEIIIVINRMMQKFYT